VVHEQAAGFVLDALEMSEARDFERHLELCPACEAELEALRVAAAALAFAGELPPPRAALRRRVLAADAIVLRFRRRWVRPALAAAALAACIALVVVVVARNPKGQNIALSLVMDARGTLLVTHGLRPAPRGKVYEIWFTRGSFATPAGFLYGRSARLERPVPPGAGVAVTLEPGRGSRHPTGPLLLRTETA
jgi:hypothetical protein